MVVSFLLECDRFFVCNCVFSYVRVMYVHVKFHLNVASEMLYDRTIKNYFKLTNVLRSFPRLKLVIKKYILVIFNEYVSPSWYCPYCFVKCNKWFLLNVDIISWLHFRMCLPITSWRWCAETRTPWRRSAQAESSTGSCRRRIG